MIWTLIWNPPEATGCNSVTRIPVRTAAVLGPHVTQSRSSPMRPEPGRLHGSTPEIRLPRSRLAHAGVLSANESHRWLRHDSFNLARLQDNVLDAPTAPGANWRRGPPARRRPPPLHNGLTASAVQPDDETLVAGNRAMTVKWNSNHHPPRLPNPHSVPIKLPTQKSENQVDRSAPPPR